MSAPGLSNDSTEVEELDGGGSTTADLPLSTDGGDTGEYTLTAQAGDNKATESVTVSEPTTSDDSVGSPDGGNTSGDDSIGSPGDGSTSVTTGPQSTIARAAGSLVTGGLGTTEMATVGGGGGLALLFRAYALMRRVSEVTTN